MTTIFHRTHSFRAALLSTLSVLGTPSISNGESASSAFPLLEVLPAAQAHQDIAGPRDLYGWMVGHWDLESTFKLPDGATGTSKGEMHAARVLDGRALQDVWLSPRLTERDRGGPRPPGAGYGTTVRAYDAKLDAWRVHWIDPENGVESHLLGRRVGKEVVQEGIGLDSKNRLFRWILFDVEPDTFRWRSESSEDGGKTWTQNAEIRGRRRPT